MEPILKNGRIRAVLLLCLIAASFSVIFVGYFCSESNCFSQSKFHHWNKINLKHVISDNMGKPISFLSHPLHNGHNKMSFDDLINDNFEFDIKGSDVMVFLHIQKTGGTAFGKHLVKDLDLEQPCMCKKGRKKCKCFRPDSEDRFWLFSRYSTGWKCGLHADWTELTSCVDTVMDQTEREASKRKYFYITLLRDPVHRFLSEFKHVQRGATWKTSRHMCGNRLPTEKELPSCFKGFDWKNVTLEEFISCKSNLAINRQTRMLADLTLVGCYNNSAMSLREREVIMLASAKKNLEKMAFFGLCEFQRMSQFIFENTFHLKFLKPFEQLNETHSSMTQNELDPDLLSQIEKLNHLDMELYHHAQSLLIQRFEKIAKANTLGDNTNALENGAKNQGKDFAQEVMLLDSR